MPEGTTCATAGVTVGFDSPPCRRPSGMGGSPVVSSPTRRRDRYERSQLGECRWNYIACHAPGRGFDPRRCPQGQRSSAVEQDCFTTPSSPRPTAKDKSRRMPAELHRLQSARSRVRVPSLPPSRQRSSADRAGPFRHRLVAGTQTDRGNARRTTSHENRCPASRLSPTAGNAGRTTGSAPAQAKGQVGGRRFKSGPEQSGSAVSVLPTLVPARREETDDDDR